MEGKADTDNHFKVGTASSIITKPDLATISGMHPSVDEGKDQPPPTGTLPYTVQAAPRLEGDRAATHTS